MHDQLAELAGYRNELDILTAHGKAAERLSDVRAGIQRLEGVVRAKAERLRAAEAGLRAAGQDGLADTTGAEAQRHEAALGPAKHAAPAEPADAAEQASQPPASETAVTDGAAAGVEQAVTRRAAKA